MIIKMILPFVPILVLFGYMALFKTEQMYQVFKHSGLLITSLFLIYTIFLSCSGTAIILDPNEYVPEYGNGNFSNLYTTARVIGWIFQVMSIGFACRFFTVIDDYISPKPHNAISKLSEVRTNTLFKAYKTIFLWACITVSLSGAYGFLTRTCWGLFETKYINDIFMWWTELGWCIAGLVGIWAYFKYIRYWQGIDRSK